MRQVRKAIKKVFAVTAAAAYTAVSAVDVCAEKTPDFNVETNVPPQIVFLGDSIISGFGLEGYSPDDKSKCLSFANILTASFDSALPPQAEFKSDNFGEDGLTSRGMLKKLRSGELDEPLREADAVVISIGGNDMLYTFIGLLNIENSLKDALGKVLELDSDLDEDLDGFEENLEEINAVLHEMTDGRIFFQTLYNPLEDTFLSSLNDLSREKIGRLNEIIKQYSEDGENYVVVDVAASFKGKSKELTNINDIDIHPNADGHKLIAELLNESITAQTYTYYDEEAAEEYEREQAEKRRKKREAEEKRTRMIMIGSGTGAAALLSVGAFLVIRRNKSKK